MLGLKARKFKQREAISLEDLVPESLKTISVDKWNAV